MQPLTLAVMALYREGTTTPALPVGARPKPTASPCFIHGLRVAQTRGHRDRGQRLHCHHPRPPADWRNAPSTPMTTTVWPCAFTGIRPAHLPVRILDPQCVAKTFPDYFKLFFFRWGANTGRPHPVILRQTAPRPQAKALAAQVAANWAITSSTPVRCTVWWGWLPIRSVHREGSRQPIGSCPAHWRFGGQHAKWCSTMGASGSMATMSPWLCAKNRQEMAASRLGSA